MRLIGKIKLLQLRGINELTDKWLISWMSEVQYARWKQTSEVLQQFPKAQLIGQNRVLFKISPCEYAIQAIIHFPPQIVLINGFINYNFE